MAVVQNLRHTYATNLVTLRGVWSNSMPKYKSTVNNLKLNKYEEALLRRMCHLTKNLFNSGLYYMNARYEELGESTSKFSLFTAFLEDENKVQLPSQVARGALAQAYDAMNAWFKALKSYQKNPGKFKACPKPPHYMPKDGETKCVFPKDHIRLREGGYVELTVQKPMKEEFGVEHLMVKVPPHIPFENLKLITVIPGKKMRAAFCYEVEEAVKELDSDKFLAIDPGVSNFLTCVTNTDAPFIINGGKLKSIIYKANKDIAHYSAIDDKCKKIEGNGRKKNTRRVDHIYEQKNNRIKHELHAISNYLIDYCIERRIGVIVVGKNEGWKQEADMSKKVNQIFVQMPHARLIDMMAYKCELNGIKLITVNESHTSKCDALALEKICHHDEYMGKRVKRGLFQSSTGHIINADVNGALNIARRGVKCDEWIKSLEIKDVSNPKKVTVMSNDQQVRARFASVSSKATHRAKVKPQTLTKPA